MCIKITHDQGKGLEMRKEVGMFNNELPEITPGIGYDFCVKCRILGYRIRQEFSEAKVAVPKTRSEVCTLNDCVASFLLLYDGPALVATLSKARKTGGLNSL